MNCSLKTQTFSDVDIKSTAETRVEWKKVCCEEDSNSVNSSVETVTISTGTSWFYNFYNFVVRLKKKLSRGVRQ